MSLDVITIRRTADTRPLFARVLHARTAWQRLRGLIGRPRLEPGEGMLITPCNSVHTLGMRYAVDVVFLDREGRILKLVTHLKPMRMAARRGARHALELPAGTAQSTGLRVGECLQWTAEEGT